MFKRSSKRRKPGGLKKRIFRKKFCKLCMDKVTKLDYKSTREFHKYTTERGKIVPRRVLGACAKHQRMIAKAVKRARQMALLPYSAE